MNREEQLVAFLKKYLTVFFGTFELLITSLFFPKSRGKLAHLAEFFGWKNPLKSYPLELPLLDPSALFSGGAEMKLNDPVGEDGNVSLLELVIINHLIKVTGALSSFEIGTFNGRTTLNMAGNGNDGAKVYTLDLPDNGREEAKKNPLGDIKFVGRAETGAMYKGSIYQNRIVQLLGDSANFDFSPYKNSIDFIFIDGAHSYEYVRSDSLSAIGMLRPGGVILWHDYRSSCEGVSRALNQFYREDERFKNLRHLDGTNLAMLSPDDLICALPLS